MIYCSYTDYRCFIGGVKVLLQRTFRSESLLLLVHSGPSQGDLVMQEVLWIHRSKFRAMSWTNSSRSRQSRFQKWALCGRAFCLLPVRHLDLDQQFSSLLFCSTSILSLRLWTQWIPVEALKCLVLKSPAIQWDEDFAKENLSFQGT